jgi:hypothetical protein
MGGDSVPMVKKFLMVNFSPKSNLNKKYNIGLHEGETCNFKF